MPTKFVPLKGEPRKHFYELCASFYLDGACYEFAVALHRGLGWQMIGLMQGSIIRHVFVQQPDGKLRDVRGVVPKDELGNPFGMDPPYELREITEDSIFAVRPVKEPAIVLAGKMAETLWPKLKWKSSQKKRFKAFADELEALSRKTGIWIRSSIPASPPMLAEGDDAEDGYILKRTAEGLGFSIDRNFR